MEKSNDEISRTFSTIDQAIEAIGYNPPSLKHVLLQFASSDSTVVLLTLTRNDRVDHSQGQAAQRKASPSSKRWERMSHDRGMRIVHCGAFDWPALLNSSANLSR